MANTLVYDTTIKTVDENGIENEITTQEFKQTYVTIDTQKTTIAYETTSQIIYQGNKNFDFINIVSDQKINIVLTDDGTEILDADLTVLQMDYSGTDLVITVTNASGYTASIQVVISQKS